MAKSKVKGGEERSSVVWNVERIGLYFYNGIDNRWAKYYENAEVAAEKLSAEGKYRTNFVMLLKTMREVLKKNVTRTRRKGPRLTVPDTPFSGRSTEIKIPEELSNGRRQHWVGYLKKCKALLKRDGIVDVELKSKIDELSRKGSAQFSGQDLWNLAPTLPIARDWDVHGAFHPMSTSSYKLTPDKYYERFFCYQLKFTDEAETGIHSPLKKAVHLNLVGESKQIKNDPEVRPIRKAFLNRLRAKKDFSYFDLAKGKVEKLRHPIHPRQEPMSESEADAYRAYAALTDTIQQKGETLRSERVDGQASNKVVYYANIPVIAAGYNHFFEITVSPSGSPPIAKGKRIELIEDCFTSFTETFIGRGERLILKESFRELLVQLRLAAFEYHVTQYMVEHSRHIHKSPRPNEWAVRCFCSLAPMINEMRVIHASGIGLWAHAFVRPKKRKEQDEGGEAEVFDMDEVLKPWTEISKADLKALFTTKEVYSKEAKRLIHKQVIKLKRTKYRIVTINDTGVEGCTIEMWLFHDDEITDTPFNRECFAGTNEQRLREQFDWVRERMLRFWSAGHP